MISIKNLNKIYSQPTGKNLVVLENLNLSIDEGQFISIIGHSGSGKSTLLNILGLLDVPSDFEELSLFQTKINDLSLRDRTRFRGKNIGFIFQSHQLLPEFTALQNVILPMRINGVSKSNAIKKAIDLLSMVFTEDEMNTDAHLRRESQLSGGQCQRVSIARALANNPPIILADEPTGSLDVSSAEAVMKILISLPKTGVTVVMITHQLELASQGDLVYKLDKGNLTLTDC